MRARRLLLPGSLGLTLGLALAGCAVTAPPEPTPTASTTATATATPRPTPTATRTGQPIDLTCDQLVSAQAIYDYNPNFALEPSFSPEPGSLAADAVAASGLACRWVNQTSGETIDLAVAHLEQDDLDAIGNALVSESNPVPTYEVEGYFRVEGGVGEAQALSAPYWISAVSVAFFEPGDAAPLMSAAIAALG